MLVGGVAPAPDGLVVGHRRAHARRAIRLEPSACLRAECVKIRHQSLPRVFTLQHAPSRLKRARQAAETGAMVVAIFRVTVNRAALGRGSPVGKPAWVGAN